MHYAQFGCGSWILVQYIIHETNQPNNCAWPFVSTSYTFVALFQKGSPFASGNTNNMPSYCVADPPLLALHTKPAAYRLLLHCSQNAIHTKPSTIIPLLSPPPLTTIACHQSRWQAIVCRSVHLCTRTLENCTVFILIHLPKRRREMALNSVACASTVPPRILQPFGLF